MEYDFRHIEKKWQQFWRDSGAYKVSNDSGKPKFYVLDMFPYPSGAGLHVGHPLGYIASDIYSRFKRLNGYNVLHPMGFDSFGLPAEQYAIETGQHPAVTTEKNIHRYHEQLDNIGFCYDWSREVRTSDPGYYKWTQYIFLQLFNSWYNRHNDRTENIQTLVDIFEREGSQLVVRGPRDTIFSAEDWRSYHEVQQQEILMQYRVAYSAFGEVNWCEALGTVLANDEVVNGVSERGGHLVVKKKMRQWYLRITEYADRLLQGLERVDYSDAMKEMQRNWIGKSQGAEIDFKINGETAGEHGFIKVYTTRPDTIFGVDFMVIAPEHELVKFITTPAQKNEIEKYLGYVKSRSERERMAEVKQITGAFTGAYVSNPFDGRAIPVWISEYVLAGYGTGAIMAVPCGDQRDFSFAKHFNIPITNIIGNFYNGEEANPTKDATLQNSGFLDGIVMREAIDIVINKLEEQGIGKRQINYRMRDAGFSRQRYWGEPFPIVYKGGVAYALDEKELPLELPYLDTYGPGPEGEGPLANVLDWEIAPGGGRRETNTMPGYAGSSWYFLRYMDPHNQTELVDRKVADYWGQVDLYIGGTEHAVGHLLYSRMWTKALYDLGFIGFDEPYKKLVNQGMIQGSSRLLYRLNFRQNAVDADQEQQAKQGAGSNPVYVSHSHYKALINIKDKTSEILEYLRPFNLELPSNTGEITVDLNPIHVDVALVDGVELDIPAFRQSKPEYESAILVLEEGQVLLPGKSLPEAADRYICGAETEKMSKSKYNVVNPDEIVNRYGADTFRMYEMFLGPVEQSKPWDTKGIEGVHRFLRKFWKLFIDEQKGLVLTNDAATPAELKVLHKTIKKIADDTERFSFNTAVSAFMVCVNELNDLRCHKVEVLEPLLILLTPYAPHISEELYYALNAFRGIGDQRSILDAAFPPVEEKYLVESSKEYPVSVNGKVRTNLTLSLDASQQEVEELITANETIQKWLEGRAPKKVIYVKNKMINVVI
ncbi:leucine--tRNA ligase [Segetibacter sp. 3557_3]|uniref:leucine--tRNA ligase n=1 Tax=Segetibacter sp. 3557_3 TaxID=2547429 RepID=UPI0010591381|nr:class I tRNA ligase family protein [Segetibacter sp. 3557_3]TDH22963.1 leucine--tRNA ligase [Segetibacter sp. 3557_3]